MERRMAHQSFNPPGAAEARLAIGALATRRSTGGVFFDLGPRLRLPRTRAEASSELLAHGSLCP
jgi:hypothetical protein